MDSWCQCLVIILFIILIHKADWLNFNESTVCSNLDGSCYKVVSSFAPDTHLKAANELAKINQFNSKLITYLRNAYLWNPAKQNSPDIRDAEIRSIAENLIKNYNPNVLKENDPGSTKNTSYVLEKGASVAFCLREKKTGQNEFENDDMITFVNLHEVSHLAMRYHDPDHSMDFWKTFKLVEEVAVEAGLYKPINFKDSPAEYCGVHVDYNPLYDNSLVIDS
jgi:hypothetical protein